MNVCTIVAKNYVAFARVLASSLREYHSDATLTVLMLDDYEGFIDPADEPFELLSYRNVTGLPFSEMADRYTILELSTAVKPWLLQTLLDRDGVDHAMYLDPDIQIVGELTEIRDLAVEHSIVLTPHMLSPIPRDGLYPQEQSILMAGAYNLGFIALGADEHGRSLLDWWKERLESDCSIDIANGLFVDQKWIDLVPGMWPSTKILHDPGCNVAYWNYHERSISYGEHGQVLVNDEPGTFLHWSGYDPTHPSSLSKYQNRISLEERPDIKTASESYGKALLACGYSEASNWDYSIRELNIGPRDSDDAPGVNVIGYLTAEQGVGEAGRQIVTALDTAGVAVTPVPVRAGVGREEHRFEHEGLDGQLQPVTLACVNADVLASMTETVDQRLIDDSRLIGFWWWETESFPTQMRPALDLVDEVWVGSEFIANALTPLSAKPVVAIPTPVTLPAGAKPDRARLGLPDGFLFLFSFDFNSVVKRKNPDGLVAAFIKAFPEPRDDVHLILKSINGDRHPADLRALAELADGRPDIVLMDRMLDAEDRDALVASCDCYVSLHRSEGFGLTIAEAMLLGKPVIATDYGGSSDFVNALTAFPVRYARQRVGAGAAPYDPDEFWAEPDLDHAASLLRQVIDSPQLAAEHAARARDYLQSHHSPAAAGKAMASRLRKVGAHSVASGANVSRYKQELPDDLAAREATHNMVSRDTTWSSRLPGRIVHRVLSRLPRRESRLRRENDEALWWSIEASSVVSSERHDELQRAHESLTKFVEAELRQVRDEIRSLDRDRTSD